MSHGSDVRVLERRDLVASRCWMEIGIENCPLFLSCDDLDLRFDSALAGLRTDCSRLSERN